MDESSSSVRFPTTHWSRVARVGNEGVSEDSAREALEELCQAYWFPLYSFIRRQGHDRDAAADLVQGLFTQLLERGALAKADSERGRFRTFLLAACRNYLSDCRDREGAQKRGGGRRPVSIDAAEAEGRYASEPADTLTPERLYERAWVLALLERVLAQLARDYEAEGKGRLFALLEPTLANGPELRPYAVLAAAAGTTEGAIQTAAHRLRRHYRALLRNEIAATLSDPADVDDEIRALFAVMSTSSTGH